LLVQIEQARLLRIEMCHPLMELPHARVELRCSRALLALCFRQGGVRRVQLRPAGNPTAPDQRADDL
jgi:hypothetical protein